jgi:hypothetical protein
MPSAVTRPKHYSDPKAAAQPEQLQKTAQQAVEEARMVLPGIQALFGFQLMAVFNARFTQLTRFQQELHFVSVILIALAIALIMTPAAYHRQVEMGGVSQFFVKLASMLVASAMLPLMVALCIEVYLLGVLIIGGRVPSLLIAGVLLCVFDALWFVFPWFKARAKSGR